MLVLMWDFELADGVEGLVRDALQEMMDCWNSVFEEAEEIVFDLCFYISPLPSTMLTARQPHAAALPLKRFFRLSTSWTSDHSVLSLALAKGRGIFNSPPDS